MMASKSMKVLNIIAGVLLIVAGIYCLCNQDIAAMTAGVMVGIFMLLSGVIEIVVFAIELTTEIVDFVVKTIYFVLVVKTRVSEMMRSVACLEMVGQASHQFKVGFV